MPPRWFGWLIGVFWMTMMGWLFWHDLWPNWRPGEPPPFHIDDVEEVLKKNGSQKTTWIVQRQIGASPPTAVFLASTWIEYQKEEDTYTLKANLKAIKGLSSPTQRVAGPSFIEKMTSEYCIDRAGRLRSLNAEVTASPHLTGLGGELLPLVRQFLALKPEQAPNNSVPVEPIRLSLQGEVRGDHFFAHCRADADYLAKPIEFDLPPAAVSHTGSVLMPLHPVNQISGLRPGQSWHQPLVDPLRDALPGLSNSVRSLNARVLPQQQMLTGDESETSCLVIEYTNDENEVMGRTWVEPSSNRVLQQEAHLEEGHWIMKRESERSSSKRKMGLAVPPQRGMDHD